MNSEKAKKRAIQLAAVGCLALGWEVVARLTAMPVLFPPLGALIGELGSLLTTADFYMAAGVSLCRGTAGLLVAFACAGLSGTAAAYLPGADAFFRPMVAMLRTVPVISFVLLALLWFSPDGLPVFIAVVTAYPIMHQSLSTALRQTDPKLVEMGKAFGKGVVDRFLHIHLPSARDMIYDGLSTAVGFGWRAVIMGEALAQPLHAIGSGMKAAQAFIRVPNLLAWTLAAILIGCLLEGLLQVLRHIPASRPAPARTPETHPHRPADVPLPPHPPAAPPRILRINHLYKQYGTHSVFADYSLTISNGAIACLRGASGRGKTTLLRLVAGLDRDYRGKIVRPEGCTVAYAFQEDRLLPWLNVRENIAYALSSAERRREGGRIIDYLLHRLQLDELAELYPHQLSGGQHRRVNLARALACRADILLLDEPLNGMDEALKSEVIHFIHEWVAAYRPVTLWATHETIGGGLLPVAEIVLD